MKTWSRTSPAGIERYQGEKEFIVKEARAFSLSLYSIVVFPHEPPNQADNIEVANLAFSRESGSLFPTLLAGHAIVDMSIHCLDSEGKYRLNTRQ